MAKKSHNGIYAIVGLVIVAAIFFGPMGGKIPSASVSTSDNTGSVSFGSNTGSTTTTGLKPGQALTVTVNHRDALTEASLTEATNVKTTLLVKDSAGRFTVVTTGSGQTTRVSDDGKVWVSFETQASGQSYIWAKDRTISANYLNGHPLISDCSYVDVEGDGTKEFVCAVSTEGLDSQVALSGTKPDRALNIKWYNEHAPTVTGVAGTDPADQSSVGTSQTTKDILWGLDGTNGDATFIREIELKLNSTDVTEWDDSRSFIQVNGETHYLSSLDFSQDGTNTYYRIKYGTDMSTSKILEIPATGNDKIPITVEMVVTLDSSEVLTNTLKVTFVNEIDGTATDSDPVNLSA